MEGRPRGFTPRATSSPHGVIMRVSSVRGVAAATAAAFLAVTAAGCQTAGKRTAIGGGAGALVGAGVGALLVNLIWTQIEGDPHPAVVILFSVAGAVVATWLQRYVIILATAFVGAWTAIIGGLAVMGNTTPIRALAAGDVWSAYPMNNAPGMGWMPWAWIALGAFGTLVQMRWTGGDRGRIGKKSNRKKGLPKDE